MVDVLSQVDTTTITPSSNPQRMVISTVDCAATGFQTSFTQYSQSLDSSHDSYLELATDVFLSQDIELVQSLKDFLRVLANPVWVETIFTQALYRVADYDPQACRWLLRHPHYLMPELDLRELALQLVINLLEQDGFVLSPNFDRETNGFSFLNDAVQVGLLGNALKGDRVLQLLLEEYVLVNN